MPDFSALSSAYSALASHRRRTEIIGQNIANVDTPGYSRLRAELTSYVGTGATGVFSGTELRTGVDVDSVTRMKDEVLEQQARQSSTRSTNLNEQARALTQVEQRLDALGDGSLSAQLDALWNGFADVANDPGALGPRQALLERAGRVATTLNGLYAATVSQRAAEVGTLRLKVGEVNDLATRIATIQSSITAAHASGTPANDLLDQQDRMVDRLSELVAVQVTKRPDGTVNLHVDGHTLLSEQIVSPLAVQEGAADAHGLNAIEITAGPGGRVLGIAGGGELGGLVTVANTTLPGHLTALDAVAAAVQGAVNPTHSAGVGLDGQTGNALFTGTTAGTFALDPALVGQPRAIGARAAGEGSLGAGAALALAAIADSPGNPALVFEQLASGVGAELSSISSKATAADAATTRARSARDAVSGVNLDEELTNLIESQRAYESAARLITTIDEMLDTLINRTGLVGR